MGIVFLVWMGALLFESFSETKTPREFYYLLAGVTLLLVIAVGMGS